MSIGLATRHFRVDLGKFHIFHKYVRILAHMAVKENCRIKDTNRYTTTVKGKFHDYPATEIKDW